MTKQPERSIEDRVKELEAQLAAMTKDRNLWQEAHDEDCPNAKAVEQRDQAEALLLQLWEICYRPYDRKKAESLLSLLRSRGLL
jgi:hypothetical protein